MIDLQQRTQKYVDVLLQLLPKGLYDNALDTNIAKDVQGHVKYWLKPILMLKHFWKPFQWYNQS